MRIAFLIPTLSAGGAERVITIMANFWAAKGHTVIVFSLDAPDAPSFFTLHPKVQLYPLDLLRDQKNYVRKIARTVGQILYVRKHIQSNRPDVLIARLDIAIFLATLATIGLKTKSIICEGTNPYRSQTNKYLKKLNRLAYYFADHLVLQTYQIAETFPSSLQKKISVIYNPVAQPALTLQPEDYHVNLTRKEVVSVGRLAFPKAYEVLIEAFYTFSLQRPDWSLLILGEGEERPRLESLCKKLGIDNKVSLPGKVRNPLEIIRTCAIFVLSSRYEGLPNALCEAMSIGMPVIATRCKFGPEEIIQHQESGLLVSVEDANAITSALNTLADNPKLCAYLGTNAKKISAILDVDAIMEQWEATIARVTGLSKKV